VGDRELRRPEQERLRALLCKMQDSIQGVVLRTRDTTPREALSHIESVTESDTIYRIDAVSESAILAWFREHWPAELSTVVIMEGLPESETIVFPEDCSAENARFRTIIDPIDGTRGLMYDKRSAWILTGVAPNRGPATTLADIEVAAMTELPVAKQRLADQVSALQSAGPEGVKAERVSIDTAERTALDLQPSRAIDLHHGFVGVSRFFPAGKALLAQFEERLYSRLYGSDRLSELAIFDDQYICSGGQLYELISGRDRLIADLRPLAYAELGGGDGMSCHPYDVCTAMILSELGGCVEHPDGSALATTLDTISPVAWVGYANPRLAEHLRSAVGEALKEVFPRFTSA
jgi:hypothetical protein